MSRDLPPGVESYMIPGNRPSDAHEDELQSALIDVWGDGWSEEDVLTLWRAVCREQEDKGEQFSETRGEQ